MYYNLEKLHIQTSSNHLGTSYSLWYVLKQFKQHILMEYYHTVYLSVLLPFKFQGAYSLMHNGRSKRVFSCKH